ncbi:MAG: gcs2 [Acidimicrobiales bacterium]|nr:gcs2 [Acidimicrobiales bacterium]
MSEVGKISMTDVAVPQPESGDGPLGLAQTERMGVEEEFHVVDLATRELVARGPDLLDRLSEDFTAELQQSVVESNSSVCTRLDELRTDLRRTRAEVVAIADDLGLGVVAAGTVPLVDPQVLDLTDSERFRQMHAEYQLLVREQLICGTQVHVDVPDRDVAVAVSQRVVPWLPVLLALSASSPFWLGQDSGYASSRSLAWQRWPTAGGSGATNASEHDALVADLVLSETISDPGMIYFDVRPATNLPTLELRIADSCPDIDTIVLMAGLFRALVRRESDAVIGGMPPAQLAPPLQRAAIWRAARSGLEGDLLDLPRSARPVPASIAVAALLEHLRAHLEAAGDWEQVSGLAERAVAQGSSAAQQRRAYARRGRLADVVDFLIAKTRGQGSAPVFTAVPGRLLDRYLAANDEALAADGSVRHDYAEILTALQQLGPQGLQARERARDDEQRSRGVTFGVPGEASTRLFPVDLVPRLVGAAEWKELSAGLVQRARALDAFLHDVYGDRAVVHDGVIPAWVIDASPGLRPIGALVRRQAVRAHLAGMDLVRDQGRWLVLEDNLRIPSGIGYAVQNRRLMENVMTELPSPPGVLAVDGVARALRETLEAAAPPAAADRGPSVALLSAGPTDPAWFEHRMLAEEMKIPVVQSGDLVVDDGTVVLHRDGTHTRVDILYLRIAEEALLHATGADGRPLGPALLGAVDQGTVALANAPGNGVGDDKAVYAFVGDLVEYYLGEKPLLAQVPTYLCGDPEQLEHALERMHELVVKPVDGYGGDGVLIGPHATEEELAATDLQVRAAPHRWIAQEMVDLSTLPTFDGGALVPRHVDLRAFVLTGERTHVLPVALTRVAPEGSLIVNSSRGGGSKDTWLLAEPAR